MLAMIGLPEESPATTRMSPVTMVEGASKSLAVECAKVCSNAARVKAVKSHAKYAKREAEAKLKQRHYHVQKHEDVLFADLKMEMHLPRKSNHKHEGLMAMYNV